MPTIKDQHIARARNLVAQALHFERFFGQPIESFSARHNELRAAANRRQVEALAFEAGTFLAYAEVDSPDYELARHPAWTVEHIRVAVMDGWSVSLELLGSKADPTTGPSGGPE